MLLVNWTKSLRGLNSNLIFLGRLHISSPSQFFAIQTDYIKIKQNTGKFGARSYCETRNVNRRYFGTDCSNSKDSTKSNVRHGYPPEIEAIINAQINIEFTAAYAFLSAACYFGKTEVGLLGTQNFFMKMRQAEIQHALALIEYQLMRGAHVKLLELPAADCERWSSITKALEVTLEMEKAVASKFNEIISLAQKHNDKRTEEYLQREFMTEQHQAIRAIGSLVSRSHKIGKTGISEYLFDKEMRDALGHTLK